MNLYYYTPNKFASTYNCSTYGSGSYNNNPECVTTTPPPQNTPTGDTLASTGYNIALPIGGGLVLIAIALAIIFKGNQKRNKKITNK